MAAVGAWVGDECGIGYVHVYSRDHFEVNGYVDGKSIHSKSPRKRFECGRYGEEVALTVSAEAVMCRASGRLV